MFKISVWHGDLSDNYLKLATQLGADCIDFGDGSYFPGVKEQGYPDLDEVLKIRQRFRSWGMDINRVTLPNITEKCMRDEEGGEAEIDNACKALQVFGEENTAATLNSIGQQILASLSELQNDDRVSNLRQIG